MRSAASPPPDDVGTDRPEPPFELKPDARVRWDRLGLAGDLDDDALLAAASYAASYGRVVELERWLAENGTVVTIRDDKGNVRTHTKSPRVELLRTERKELDRHRRALSAYGIAVPHRPLDPSTNRYNLELTLEELAERDALRPIDAATIAAVSAMADELDLDPGNAQLWRQYLALTEELLADDSDRDAPSLADQLAGLMSPEVRDAPPA